MTMKNIHVRRQGRFCLCAALASLGFLPALPVGAAPDPAAVPDLRESFENPPDSAKTRTWWHWVSGNVSAEGITADLEAMKRVGVAGAQMFTVDQSAVKGPIVFMSPEWRKLVHHALSEADRLNLEMSMEGCDGWSESGGPWITPAQSMQKVVWTETRITGGQKIALTLPQPETIAEYYQDIALLAFPTIAGDDLPEPAAITASSPKFDGNKLLAHEAVKLPAAKPNEHQWVQLAFAKEITCSSLALSASAPRKAPPWELQASVDGTHFKKICALPNNGIVSFPTTTAKFFRLAVGSVANGAPARSIAAISLQGPRIDRTTARSGMAVDISVNAFSNGTVPANAAVAPAALVDLTGKQEWEAPPGQWTIIRLGHTSTGAHTHPSTSAGLECDKLSRAAVEAQFKGMFGDVIADSEPLIGRALRYVLLDSWEAGCENWTPKMAEEFSQRRGYDLHPWLPVLTGRIVGSVDESERFLWDYRRTLADLVAEQHYGSFQDLAHQHHMGLYAEASGIGMPTVADQLQCKGHTDIPMGEFWVSHTRDGNIDDPKEAASAAHIYGQNIAATESFTSTAAVAAWTNDPFGLKAMGDQEFCLGVNRFIFHRFAHQPWLDRKPGMSMGPWGINFDRTNTWWEQGRAWLTYLARCQDLLQRGRFAADLVYFYGEGAPICVHHKDLQPAVPAGFDYDVCNAEVLLRSMSVEDGQVALASGMRYRVLVLPETNRMTLPVLEKIQSLVNAGATIYGPWPEKSPSLAGFPESDQKIQAIAKEVWGDCDGKTITEHACGKGKVCWGLPLEKVLAVPSDFAGGPGKDQLFIHRKEGATDLYFVSNQEHAAYTVPCSFRVAGKVPELWHPDTGQTETVALYHVENGCTTLPIHFDPVGSVFVVFRNAASGAAPVAAVRHNGQDLLGSGEAPAELPVVAQDKVEMTAWQGGAYEVVNAGGQTIKAEVPALPPALTLDGPWQVSFPPKLGAPEKATFAQLISWADSPDAGIKYFSGTATYQQDLTIPAELLSGGKSRRLYLDLGTVKNLAEVSLNGKPLGILWKAPFRVEITAAAQAGANHLEIKITNLWPNRLIGDEKLPAAQRITWASVQQYKADSPLLPSGLLGPVTIVPAQQVTFP